MREARAASRGAVVRAGARARRPRPGPIVSRAGPVRSGDATGS
jgi:hypothetical protein